MENNIYTTQEIKGQGDVLFKNGEQTFCPFQQPIPTQGIGGVSLMRMPCSTNCPLAEINQSKSGVIEYWVGCGSEDKVYELHNKVLVPETGPSILI